MKYTKHQLNDMQEYLVGQLKILGTHHSYPKEERTLNLLLVMIADQRIDTSNYDKTSSAEKETKK